MAGCSVSNAAVGLGVDVGNGIIGVDIGGVVGATTDCDVGDAAASAGLACAAGASPSSEHAPANAAIAASVKIIRKEWITGRR